MMYIVIGLICIGFSVVSITSTFQIIKIHLHYEQERLDVLEKKLIAILNEKKE